MKIRYLVFAFISFISLSYSLNAQEKITEYNSKKDNDVQLRLGAELEKKINKKFSVSWSEELRLNNNVTRVDRIYSDLSFSYKVLKWIKLSAGYTFISIDHEGKKKDNYNNYWDFRHRLSIGSTFSYKTDSNWEFSLKERVQCTFLTEDEIDEREKSNPKWVLKSKVMAQYKMTRIPIVPYASIELCNTLNAPSLAGGQYIEKVRSSIGVVYRINKRNSIDFYYRFDYNIDKKIDVKKSTGMVKSITDEKEYNNIFSVSYKYKF